MYIPLKKALSMVLATALTFTMAIPSFAVEGNSTDSGLKFGDIAAVTLDSGNTSKEITVTVLDSGNQAVSDATVTATSENSDLVETAVSDYTVTVSRKSGSTNSEDTTVTVNLEAQKVGYDKGTGSFTVTVKADDTGSEEPTEITGAQAVSVTAPVTGEAPQTTITARDNYTGAITWIPNVTEKFAAETAYKATVTLTANESYKFAENATITVAGATMGTDTVGAEGATLANTATFPETAAAPEAPSSEALIKTFGFTEPKADGVINGKAIAVTVPSGTDVTKLSPAITVSDGAQVSPAGGIQQDFTAPVKYMVTAADTTTTAEYTVTVTVKKATTYTVTFNTMGGSKIDSQTVVSNGKAVKPETNPTKEGYIFANWYEDESCTKSFSFDTAITKDTTVYAKWTAKPTETEALVTFDTDKGTAIDPIKVTKGQALGTKMPANPTKEGSVFAGWVTKDTAGKETAFDSKTTVSSDITVYAKWTVKTFTVTFMDGDKTLDNLTVKNVEWGTSVQKPTTPPTKEGYTFVGWYTTAQCTTVFDFGALIKADTKIFAGFKNAQIGNATDKIEEAKTPEAAKEAVDELIKIGKEEMLKDPDFMAKGLGKAADAYAETANIKVEKPKVSANVDSAISAVAKNIEVVGAALSANPEDTVQLKVEPATVSKTNSDVIAAAKKETGLSNVKVNDIVAVELNLTLNDKVASLKTPVTITIPVPSTVSGKGWYLIHLGGNKEIVPVNGGSVSISVTSMSPFAFAQIEETTAPTPGGGSHSGGGGGGGGTGGSTIVNKNIAANKINTNTGYTTVSASAAASAATKAVTQAVNTKTSNAVVALQNVKAVDPSVFKAINDAATKAAKGAVMTVSVQMDTIAAGKVAARMYLDPAAAAKLTAPVGTIIETASNNAVNASVIKMFGKYFSNNVAVVSFSQKGAFGMPVTVAVKADLSKLNPKALRFYSYDTATNSYTAIAQPAYFVDTNGYVHFTTNLGGSVVITDKPLTSK